MVHIGRARGALLGQAVGDALGTTYEFERLEQPPYPALATGPAASIVGAGPFDLPPGAITDDTQMAVCLARSLAEHRGLDVRDVARRYVAWSDEAFDIGNQTRAAIARLEAGEDPRETGRRVWHASGRGAAGNGSLMRCSPIAVALAGRQELVEAAVADSLITHADPRCVLACAAFAGAIGAAVTAVTAGGEGRAVAGQMFDRAHLAAARAGEMLAAAWQGDAEDARAVAAAAEALREDLAAARADEPGVYGALHVHRTAGFVRVAFRIAFWHLAHTASWHDALVDVASRGGDADTNAAIAGALLGARDGEDAIPAEWRERVLAATQPGSPAWADAHHPKHLFGAILDLD